MHIRLKRTVHHRKIKEMLSSFTHSPDILNTQEEINGPQNCLVTIILKKKKYSTEEINHVPMWSLKCSDGPFS